ncbi:hypothetical protein, partial [Endozoicomonas sp.]|uniref:hypothetical protein n=1 Tax=Endozoicomonas sp. TaxID=1892382 RepID=UPI00383B95C1
HPILRRYPIMVLRWQNNSDIGWIERMRAPTQTLSCKKQSAKKRHRQLIAIMGDELYQGHGHSTLVFILISL